MSALVPHTQRRNERLLRDAHASIFAHPLLAFLLLVEQLFLAADIAAIAFGRHVLAHRGDRFARDHLAADRGLDRDLEEVSKSVPSLVWQP